MTEMSVVSANPSTLCNAVLPVVLINFDPLEKNTLTTNLRVRTLIQKQISRTFPGLRLIFQGL